MIAADWFRIIAGLVFLVVIGLTVAWLIGILVDIGENVKAIATTLQARDADKPEKESKP